METGIVPLQDMERMADVMGRTGMFKMNPDELLSLMFIAQAEGKHPAIAAQEYDIIKGRPALNSKSAQARFQAAGGTLQWLERSDTKCTIKFTHPAGGDLTLTWDMKRAAQAGLTGKDNWKQYPAQMLAARCVAEGVRALYPACLSGWYITEEVQDIPTRNVTPEPVQIEPATGAPQFEPEPVDPRVLAIYQQFRDYIASGLIGEKAEKSLIAAMDGDETRVEHLERMLARVKQIHDEAIGRSKPASE